MSQVYIPAEMRRRVAEEARYRCGYSLTLQAIIGMPLHIEHIIPLAACGLPQDGIPQPIETRVIYINHLLPVLARISFARASNFTASASRFIFRNSSA